MFITYMNLFVYVKIKLCKKWIYSIKVFSLMIVIIPSLQLVIYFSIKTILDLLENKNVMGIIVNCIVCIVIILWKKEYLYYLGQKLVKWRGGIIGLIIIFFVTYVLDIYRKSDFTYKSVTLLSFMGIVGVGMVSILLLNAENEKKLKAKELQMYEIYNRTFEEAIITIRARQHEFDNHIQAIKCLQYIIEEPNELIKAQNEYCDKVLNENSFNKLLKLYTEPILTGFLYSKLMNAQEQGIKVHHEVHTIELRNRVNVCELIEVIGILLDNATEALLSENIFDRILIIKILQEEKDTFSVEVSNRSRKYTNSDIEKFCLYGYSTKGEDRGIGLARAKEITQKYDAEFYIENISYNEKNFLCFKLVFPLKKGRN